MKNKKQIILTVDDQPVILRNIALQLKDLYQVKSFTSGESVLEYLELQYGDLIILDCQMPGMSGMEVLEILRKNKRTQSIPVVFLTGSENDDTEVEALEKGASDYIQKPIKARILLSRIHLQLELKRYREHMEALVEEKTGYLQQANEKLKLREDITLNMLAETADMHDHYTGGHINRTTEMARIIVTDLLEHPKEGYMLSSNEAENIIRSAKLHDIGKIAIPGNILTKPGKLDENELDLLKTHSVRGAGLFDKYIMQMGEDSFLNTAKDIAMSHHEKWDGSGYPLGLAGKEIPLSARITALADVYDALTSTRSYKGPFSHSEAYRIITEESGRHFDPYLVTVFIRREKEFEKILVRINDAGQCDK